MRRIAILLGLAFAAPPFVATAFAQPMPAMSPADQSLAAGMTAMNHTMSAAPMTGNPDQDFAAMMIPHHQGAIDMCKAELQNGKDHQLRALCHNIITAQNKEIAEMKAWQKRHPAS